MKKSFEIESDCLDIVKRLKEIDKDYFVVFNTETHKFELHNRQQKRNTYCLTLPFETLDERTIFYVLKTSVKNCESLFEEMERKNKLLRQKQVKEILNDFEEKFYDS